METYQALRADLREEIRRHLGERQVRMCLVDGAKPVKTATGSDRGVCFRHYRRLPGRKLVLQRRGRERLAAYVTVSNPRLIHKE